MGKDSTLEGAHPLAWQPEFNPWHPHGGRKEPIPIACSLISTPVLCMHALQVTHTHVPKIKIWNISQFVKHVENISKGIWLRLCPDTSDVVVLAWLQHWVCLWAHIPSSCLKAPFLHACVHFSESHTEITFRDFVRTDAKQQCPYL